MIIVGIIKDVIFIWKHAFWYFSFRLYNSNKRLNHSKVGWHQHSYLAQLTLLSTQRTPRARARARVCWRVWARCWCCSRCPGHWRSASRWHWRGFNYLALVAAKSGQVIVDIDLTDHLSSLQPLCSCRPLPEFCFVLLLLQSKTFSICYNKSFNLMWHLTIQNWEDILVDIISPIVSYLVILNNKIANRTRIFATTFSHIPILIHILLLDPIFKHPNLYPFWQNQISSCWRLSKNMNGLWYSDWAVWGKEGQR